MLVSAVACQSANSKIAAINHSFAAWVTATVQSFTIALVLLFGWPVVGQFELTRVNLVCPCSLETDDGATAVVQFGLVNHTRELSDDLHLTLGIVGNRTSSTGADMTFADFIATAELGVSLESNSTLDDQAIQVELAPISQGDFYFELILHDGEWAGSDSKLDSIWFQGEYSAPFTELSLIDANYLIDSDGDGVDDINELLENSDPNDPEITPGPPVIDVLFVHEKAAFEHYNATPEAFIGHVVNATNDMFARSNSPVVFRPVGVLNEIEVPEVESGDEIEIVRFEELLEEYGADTVLIYRTFDDFLCGFAVQIGGIDDKGFLHPNEQNPFTELFLDPTTCALDVTAHEIGHLMGLGHSFVQQATGSFVWSRGHGVQSEFATIMTYAESAYRATAIDLLSNPLIDCHGKPCGVPHTEPNDKGSANAALTVNITKYQYARIGTPDDEIDFDGDGVGAVSDVFPIDPTEWADTDGDGYGDNLDQFDEDPLEWLDTDGDGIGNNSDPDIDNDGVPNHQDVNPFDPTLDMPKHAHIASEERADLFGYYSTQINDLDGDGLDDLVIAAPQANNAIDESTGKVYLFSLADILSPLEVDDANQGRKSLQDLVHNESSWVFTGGKVKDDLGKQLLHVSHADGSNELVILSKSTVYLVDLDGSSLRQLDELDETADQRVHLDHCKETAGCTRIDFDEDIDVSSIGATGDLDGDGLSELAFLLIDATKTNEVSLVILNRQGLAATSSNQELESFSLLDVLDQDPLSYRLITNGIDVSDEISTRLAGTNANQLEVMFGVRRDNNDSGRIYLISQVQLSRLAEFDTNADGNIVLNDLLESLLAYRIRDPGDSQFGNEVSAMANLGSNNDSGVLVWGRPGRHLAFTDAGIRLQDLEDGALDGKVILQDSPHDKFGTWRFNRISYDGQGSNTEVLPSLGENSPNLLITPHSRALLVAEISDLTYLDDPNSVDFNSIVNLPIRIRYPGIYSLRTPFGPRGQVWYSGVTSIGDVDKDGKHDFLFCQHSGDVKGRFSSCFVVHSSELELLDRADGIEDSIVMLQNSAFDLDGDGIPNLHDQDDDGDGLSDIYDVYPHLTEFQYDADGDGYANAIDVAPLNFLDNTDLDSDGIGDRHDEDRDGDGIPNDEDEFPDDTDNDGIRNEDDPDDDNDLVLDDDDAFPLDPSESLDTDGDGYGDNIDAFTMDPDEWLDTDQDGIGNNTDPDDDNDGYLDVDDAFPLLASEWLDTDGDGVGDNTDQFPLDPLEWEDLDGDGFGDNFGPQTFASYRLTTYWQPADSSRFLINEVLPIGDLNRDGKGDLELSNLLPNSGPATTTYLLTSELETLDNLDGKADYTIDIQTISMGTSSFSILDSTLGTVQFRFGLGAVGDVDLDGSSDIVIFEPITATLQGWVTVMFGDDWGSIDGEDQLVDGKLDLVSCLEIGACTRITSEEFNHGLGLSGDLLFSPAGNGTSSVAIGTFRNQSRSSGREGLPSAFILSGESIRSAGRTSTDNIVNVDELIDESSSWAFYPEFDTLMLAAGGTIVNSIKNLDQDGSDDVAISTPLSSPPRIYLIASSEHESMDSGDFTSDQKINLRVAYRQPLSYRLDGFLLVPSTFHSSFSEMNMPNNNLATFIVLGQPEGFQGMLLADLAKLEDIDRSEGIPNGIITNMEPGSNNTWGIHNSGATALCKPDKNSNRASAIALIKGVTDSGEVSGKVELVVFDLGNLRELDLLDGNEDGILNPSQLANQGVADTWHISLGELTKYSDAMSFNCAGDFDGDGYEDISMFLFDENGGDIRSQVFLLAHSDLETLDKLDGNADSHVNLTELFATP